MAATVISSPAARAEPGQRSRGAVPARPITTRASGPTPARTGPIRAKTEPANGPGRGVPAKPSAVSAAESSTTHQATPASSPYASFAPGTGHSPIAPANPATGRRSQTSDDTPRKLAANPQRNAEAEARSPACEVA